MNACAHAGGGGQNIALGQVYTLNVTLVAAHGGGDDDTNSTPASRVQVRFVVDRFEFSKLVISLSARAERWSGGGGRGGRTALMGVLVVEDGWGSLASVRP